MTGVAATKQWVDELVDNSALSSRPCLRLLTTPYLRVCDRDVAIPDGSQRLLVFVALRRDRVDRRVAAGTLWPTGGDDRAAGNLRSALWRLKRAGLDVVRSDKHNLWTDPSMTIDLDVVDRWATRLITSSASAADLALGASGPLVLEMLPGWYDEWIIFERERVRQRQLHGLEALSAALVAAGRTAEGLDVALSVVAAEPLRESAQRVLLAAHVAEGNWVEARRSFLAYSALLKSELGITPRRDAFEILVGSSPTAAVLGQRLPVSDVAPSVRHRSQVAPAGRTGQPVRRRGAWLVG